MSIKVSDGQLDFLGLLNEYTDDQGAKVRVREPGGRKSVVRDSGDFTQISFENDERFKDFLFEKPEKPAEEEPKPEPPKVETKAEPKPESKPEPKPVKTLKKDTSGPTGPEMLFKQCKSCWCYDCRHNARGKAVPREICGKSMPCPACKSCEEEGMATICEIGNAKEGCMTRAIEEGVFVPEEM
ncbi:MAG: hypothetical protein K5796_05245 [Lachnospiraceae bacterium]|nr:hypothetical protein [Lachnospiraceae bacterium]